MQSLRMSEKQIPASQSRTYPLGISSFRQSLSSRSLKRYSLIWMTCVLFFIPLVCFFLPYGYRWSRTGSTALPELNAWTHRMMHSALWLPCKYHVTLWELYDRHAYLGYGEKDVCGQVLSGPSIPMSGAAGVMQALFTVCVCFLSRNIWVEPYHRRQVVSFFPDLNPSLHPSCPPPEMCGNAWFLLRPLTRLSCSHS